MARNPVMPLWVSDFLGSAACAEMDGDHQAVYLLMLVHLWNLRERGLPSNQKDLRRLLRLSLRLFNFTFASLSHHFYERKGRLFHTRVDEELAKLMARSKSQSQGAKKRWENEQRRKLEERGGR